MGLCFGRRLAWQCQIVVIVARAYGFLAALIRLLLMIITTIDQFGDLDGHGDDFGMHMLFLAFISLRFVGLVEGVRSHRGLGH